MFPKCKILVRTKLNRFADNRLNVAKIMISHFDIVENNMEKVENAGYQYFLLFPQCFLKPSPSGLLKVGVLCLRTKYSELFLEEWLNVQSLL